MTIVELVHREMQLRIALTTLLIRFVGRPRHDPVPPLMTVRCSAIENADSLSCTSGGDFGI